MYPPRTTSPLFRTTPYASYGVSSNIREEVEGVNVVEDAGTSERDMGNCPG